MFILSMYVLWWIWFVIFDFQGLIHLRADFFFMEFWVINDYVLRSVVMEECILREDLLS